MLILDIISYTSNVFTIIASGIAIFLFFTKSKKISTILNLLMNYTYQLSLSELKEKLEKLNDYNAKDPKENERIIFILNEISGQIKGNHKLSTHFSELALEINKYAICKQPLSEPRKRALVSELRERLRHLNVHNIDDLVGETR